MLFLVLHSEFIHSGSAGNRDCMSSQQLVDFVREELDTVSLPSTLLIELRKGNIWSSASSSYTGVKWQQHLQETKLSAVCERVFDRCLAPTAGGEGCDNMTMIIVQFNKPPRSHIPSPEQPSASDQQSQ